MQRKLTQQQALQKTQQAYDLFGMDFKKTYTDTELRSIFRKVVFKVHPDKGGSNEECIKVNKAYEWLMYLRKQGIQVQAKKPERQRVRVVYTYNTTATATVNININWVNIDTTI